MLKGDRVKIDLRKSRASTVMESDLEFDDDFVVQEESALSKWISQIDINPAEILAILIRVCLCCAGTVLLIQVEKSRLNKVKAQKAVVQGEFDQLNQEKQNLQNQVKGFSYMQKKSQEFNNKLAIMKKVAKKKLKVIKGLDQMQDVIPDKMWLKRINYRQDKFTIEGAAETNKQVQNFIEALEGTRLFSGVKLERVQEQDRTKRRTFTISSVLRSN